MSSSAPLLLRYDDWQLCVFRESTLLYNEPAVAWEERGSLTFGQEARAHARIHPRQTNGQYLAKLNGDALAEPLKSARNNADLIYQHLQSLRTQLELADAAGLSVSVSSSISNDQLGVLLGIATEAGLQISGFVDAAVLGCAAVNHQGPLQWLELHQHSATLTELSVGGSGDA